VDTAVQRTITAVSDVWETVGAEGTPVRHTDTHTDIQTDKHTDRQTYRLTVNHRCSV